MACTRSHLAELRRQRSLFPRFFSNEALDALLHLINRSEELSDVNDRSEELSDVIDRSEELSDVNVYYICV
jgi:hypothetical protein